MSQTPTRADARPKPKKKHDRTHYLYVAVIVAVVAGILVGWLAPSVGKQMAVLGTTFLTLIKMIVPPIIFSFWRSHSFRKQPPSTRGLAPPIASVFPSGE